jgi:hypothetical protein
MSSPGKKAAQTAVLAANRLNERSHDEGGEGWSRFDDARLFMISPGWGRIGETHVADDKREGRISHLQDGIAAWLTAVDAADALLEDFDTVGGFSKRGECGSVVG